MKTYNGIIFGNDLSYLIFKNHFGLIEQSFTLEDIAKTHSLTKERIRQKKEKIIEHAEVKLKVLKNLIPYSNYEKLIRGESLITISEETEFIQHEFENVGSKYASFILGIIFSPDYYSISSIDKISRPKQIDYYDRYKAYRKIRSAYIVSDKIISKNNFLHLYSFLLEKICNRHEEAHTLQLNIPNF